MKKEKTQSPRQLTVIYRAAPHIVITLLLFAVFAWTMYLNFTDTTGMIGFFTAPVLLIVAISLIATAVGWFVLAAKSSTRRHKLIYAGGALVTLMPIIVTSALIFTDIRLDQEAEMRAKTPISLSEARGLVESCRVETIHRYNGGTMRLNEYTPVIPGGDSRPERRTYDVAYYDELLALARRKDVEDRCGFVPTYDIERTKKPVLNKWITRAEAEAIMDKCLWNTDLYEDSRYLKSSEYPVEPMTTGILLNQRLSVWNDDTESRITLVRVDEETAAALKQKDKSCFDRQIEQWKSAR